MFIPSVPLKVTLTLSKFSYEVTFPKVWIEMFRLPSDGNFNFDLRFGVILDNCEQLSKGKRV